MDSYNSYCTEEQTRKALELGAPVIKIDTRDKRMIYYDNMCFPKIADYPYAMPTAEQMINWLEDGIFREVNVQEFANYWEYNLYTSSDDVVSHKNHFRSRKEAALAAIDAALEYLINQKTNNHED